MRKIAISCLCFAVSALTAIAGVSEDGSFGISVMNFNDKRAKYLIGEDVVVTIAVENNSVDSINVGQMDSVSNGEAYAVQLTLSREKDGEISKKGNVPFVTPVTIESSKNHTWEVSIRTHFDLDKWDTYTITARLMRMGKVICFDGQKFTVYRFGQKLDDKINPNPLAYMKNTNNSRMNAKQVCLVAKDWIEPNELYLLTTDDDGATYRWKPQKVDIYQGELHSIVPMPKAEGSYIGVRYRRPNDSSHILTTVFSTRDFKPYGRTYKGGAECWQYSVPPKGVDPEVFWKNWVKWYKGDKQHDWKSVMWGKEGKKVNK